MALGLSEPSSLRGSTSVPVWLNIKAMTGCALIEYVIILNMCLQFRVDNYLLQVMGWALTEYGTIRYEKSFVSAPLQINIYYESAAQLAVKRVPERNIYRRNKGSRN